MKLEDIDDGHQLSIKMQNLNDVIAKLSQDRSTPSPGRRRETLLLVSEAANACVSLADLEKEEERSGRVDLHQCGHCKSMFNNMTKFISHKLQKDCKRDQDTAEDAWKISNDGVDNDNRAYSFKDATPEGSKGNAPVNNADRQSRKRNVRKGYSMQRFKQVNDDYEGDRGYEENPKISGPFGYTTRAEDISGHDISTNSYGRHLRHGSQDGKHVDFDNLSSVDSVPRRDRSYINSFISRNSRKHDEMPEYPCPAYPETNSAETIGKQERGIPINLSQVTAHSLPSRHPEQLRQEVSISVPKPPLTITRPYSNPGMRNNNVKDGKSRVPRPYSASELTQSRLRESYEGQSNPTDAKISEMVPRQPENTPNNISKLGKNERSGVEGKKSVYTHADKHTLNQQNGGQHLDGSNFIAAFDAKQSVIPSLGVDSINDRSLCEVSKDRSGGPTEPVPGHFQYPCTDTTVLKEQEEETVQNDEENKEHVKKLDDRNTDEMQRNSNRTPSLQHFKTETDYDKDDVVVEEGTPEGNESDVTGPYTPDKSQIILPPYTDTRPPKRDTIQEVSTFLDLSSPEKERSSPRGSNHGNDNEDFPLESQVPGLEIPPHHRLTESMVERLITVPVSGGSDVSWKHSKQMYSCPLCAKVFPFKSKLQRHVLVHTGIKPYKCTVCGRGFTQQIDLQRHLTRHTGEKPFKCHLCTAQFIRADNLKKHCKESHFISIEEPIRKRRRKTTGSDTVLPSLEVAIALAFSETERNGGRVLGRAASRQNNMSQEKSKQNVVNANHEDGIRGADDVPHLQYNATGKYSPLPTLQYQVAGSTDSPRYSSNHPDYTGKYSRRLPGKAGGCFPGIHQIDDSLPSQVDLRDKANEEDNQFCIDANLSYGRSSDEMTNSPRHLSSSYPPGNQNKGKVLPPNTIRSEHAYPPTLMEAEYNQTRHLQYRRRGQPSVDGNDDVFLRNDNDRFMMGNSSDGNCYRRVGYAPDGSRRQQRDGKHLKQPPPQYSATLHHISNQHHQTLSNYNFHGEVPRSGVVPTLVPSVVQEFKQQDQSQSLVRHQRLVKSRHHNEWDSTFGFRDPQNADNILETDAENDVENDVELSAEDNKTVQNEESDSEKCTQNERNPHTEFSHPANSEYSRSTNMFIDEEEIPIVTRSDDLPYQGLDL